MELMRRTLRYGDDKRINLYHLCYYHSRNQVKDNHQKLVLDFKRYEEPAARYFIIQSIEKLQHLDLDNDMMIVRALASAEIRVGDIGSFALDRLGASLANVFDCTYEPSIIYKKRKISQVKNLSLAERQSELKGLYGFDREAFSEYKKLLVIDDIVTTGATVCAIIEPIIKAYPKTQITVFSLAWTPTAKQQEQIHNMQVRATSLGEPELAYGYKTAYERVDEDFENGQTNVSIYPTPI